jgi:acetyl-CoA acetyltransferase
MIRPYCTPWAGVAPRIMGTGPAIAIPRLLAKVGVTKEDVDLFEVGMKMVRTDGEWLTIGYR